MGDMPITRNPPKANKPAFEMVEQLGFVRLYLDDLDEFMRFLRARSAHVVLGAGSATADEPEDLKGATSKELAGVTLRTVSPGVQIWLNRDKCTIRTSEDSEAAQALVADSAALLRQHRGGRAHSFWIDVLRTGILPLVVLAVAWVTTLGIDRDWNAAFAIFVSAIGGWIILFALTWNDARKAGAARLVLHSRSEARELNTTTRNLVLVSVLGAIGGAVISAVITWILNS